MFVRVPVWLAACAPQGFGGPSSTRWANLAFAMMLHWVLPGGLPRARRRPGAMLYNSYNKEPSQMVLPSLFALPMPLFAWRSVLLFCHLQKLADFFVCTALCLNDFLQGFPILLADPDSLGFVF